MVHVGTVALSLSLSLNTNMYIYIYTSASSHQGCWLHLGYERTNRGCHRVSEWVWVCVSRSLFLSSFLYLFLSFFSFSLSFRLRSVKSWDALPPCGSSRGLLLPRRIVTVRGLLPLSLLFIGVCVRVCVCVRVLIRERLWQIFYWHQSQFFIFLCGVGCVFSFWWR